MDLWYGLCGTPADFRHRERLMWRWFSFFWINIEGEERCKTKTALSRIVERLPLETLTSLKTIRLGVLAPSSNLGIAWRVGSITHYIYLAETLETYTQPEVDFTVAHEFAHIVLNHSVPKESFLNDVPSYDEKLDERQADALAESWGFYDPNKKPPYRFWGEPEITLWD